MEYVNIYIFLVTTLRFSMLILLMGQYTKYFSSGTMYLSPCPTLVPQSYLNNDVEKRAIQKQEDMEKLRRDALIKATAAAHLKIF